MDRYELNFSDYKFKVTLNFICYHCSDEYFKNKNIPNHMLSCEREEHF